MQKMYKCPQCGKDVAYITNPCPNCKLRLDWRQQSPIPYIASTGEQQQQVVQQSVEAPKQNEISTSEKRNFIKHDVAAIIKKVEYARRKELEKTLPKGKTIEQYIDEEVTKLRKFYIYLKICFEAMFKTQQEIETKIGQIESQTKQHLYKDKFVKEVWALRCTCLYWWFNNIKPPKNQRELTENESLISHAFWAVLESKGESDSLSWIIEGFNEYIDTHQFQFDEFTKFEEQFVENVAEKVVSISFNCTGGRCGGEQFDSIVELIQTTVESDKTAFEL